MIEPFTLPFMGRALAELALLALICVCEPRALIFFRRFEILTQITLISASLSHPQTFSIRYSAEKSIPGERISNSIS